MELKELSPAALAVVQNKALEGEWDYEPFGDLLRQLLAFDTVGDKRAAFRKRALVLFVITAILGTLMGLILLDGELETQGWVLLTVGLASIPAAIYFAVRWLQLNLVDLPETKLNAVMQLFRMLYHDLHPNGKIQVRMDLSGLTEAKRTSPVETEPVGYVGNRQTIYMDPWCHLRFRLRDGYVVSLRQLDQVTELRRRRRNKRGKVKIKFKYTKLSRVRVTLIPPEPLQFQAPGPVDAEWERVRAGHKKGRTVAVWDRWFRYKQKGVTPKQTPSGAELAGVILRVCSLRPPQKK